MRPSPIAGLTRTRQAVFRGILEFLAREGRFPTGVELAEVLGRTPDATWGILRALARLIGISSDGMNWNFQYFYDAGHLESVVYGNGTVVAGSWSFNKVLVSTDGQNWRVVHTQCENSAMSVAFGGGIFAHTSAGALCTSP